jgi:hypothetical protein
MGRSLAIVALVYACGHPGFDGYRPAAFDRTLRSFHGEVNAAARDGRRVFILLDDARSMRYLQSYGRGMQAILDRL